MHLLLNITMNDGSRHFGVLPQATLWYSARDHVGKLPGARVTDFITDDVTEAWIDFEFHDNRFTINDQFGEYWFFVNDPACPDDVLYRVLEHFAELLGPGDP